MFLAFTVLAVIFRFPVPSDNDEETGDTENVSVAVEGQSSLKGGAAWLRSSGRTKSASSEIVVDTFVVPVVCGELPADRRVRFFPTKVRIVVVADVGVDVGFDETDFVIGVDYDCMRDTTRLACPLAVCGKPRWVKECRISPVEVESLLE